MSNIVTGGSGQPSAALKKVVDGFKGDAEKKLGHKFQEFNPTYYRFHIVAAGLRYLVVVETNKDEHFKSFIGVELLQSYHGEDTSQHGKWIFIDAVPLYTLPVTQPGGPIIPATSSGWNPLWGIGPVIPQQETQQPTEQNLGAKPPGLFGPYSEWKPADKRVADIAAQVKAAAEEYLGTTFTEYTPKEYRSRPGAGIRFGQYEIVVQTGRTPFVIHDVPESTYTQLNVSVSVYGQVRATLGSAESLGVELPQNPKK